MNINSLTFLYFFLPAALILFNLAPKKLKNPVLAAVSTVFIALSQPDFLLFYVVDIVILFILSEAVFRFSANEKKKKLIFIFSVIFNVFVILFSSLSNQIEGRFAPFAAMVISFTAIGYFVDLNKGETEPIRSFLDFFVFIGFFGKLFRGPLIRTKNYIKLSSFEKFSLTETGNGLYLFIRGLAKYVVLALPLVSIHEKLLASNSAEVSTVGAWLDMIVFSMMIFFDLSGFCDMAMGLGQCFGMELPKNFYFPFQSPLVTDFLDRFNMTVTSFFRHYVYDVLRNDKNSKPQFIVNTFLICMLCGIWFGIKMNYIIWGLYIAVFIITEEFFLKNLLLKIPRIFARVYTFAVTIFSMIIFSAENSTSIIPVIKAMFGIGSTLVTDEVSYIVSQNILVLAASAFFFISAFSMLIHYISKKHPKIYGAFAVLESAVLLIFITASLI